MDPEDFNDFEDDDGEDVALGWQPPFSAPRGLILPRPDDYRLRVGQLRRAYPAARPCALCGKHVSKQRFYMFVVAGEAICDDRYGQELVAEGRRNEGTLAVHGKCFRDHGLKAATMLFPMKDSEGDTGIC